MLVGLLSLAALACGGTVESGVSALNVRITGVAQYVCPTSTPRPTHTPLPTATQAATQVPALVVTPMTYFLYPPICNTNGILSYRYVCPPHPCLALSASCGARYIYPTAYPNPPGYWAGGGYGLGATSTPRPTHTPRPTYTPYPTPTPYILSENYPLGSDVYVGAEGGLQLRLQVRDVQVHALSDGRQVVSWWVEIGNVGSLPYNALPGAQSFISHLQQAGQIQAGQWYASREAAQAANITLDPRTQDILSVGVGQTVGFTLTAFTAPGQVHKVAWILDPYSGGTGGGIVGGNTALWVNELQNNNCLGNVGDGFLIPTPSALAPTATASVTPYIPPFSGHRP